MEKNGNNSQYSELLYNLSITIGIILLICIIFYSAYSYIYPDEAVELNSIQQLLQSTAEQLEQSTSNLSQSSDDSQITPDHNILPVSEEINSYPIGNSEQEQMSVIQQVQSAPVITKEIYTKLEEITLPSSKNLTTNEYVERD